MRYLRKFNEELKQSTYDSAARKLKAKGHQRRSQELEQHGEIMRWKENIEEFKKWGKFSSNFNHMGSGTEKGDFYLGLQFMDDPTEESVWFAKRGEEDEVKIYFNSLFIPANEITLNVYLSKQRYGESDFRNGFIWGFFPTLEYDIEDGELKFKGLDLGHDNDTKFWLSRRGAVIFKKQLLTCFDQGSDYDSGFTDIKNMYEKIRDSLNKEDFFSEFNYTMEDIYNDIKKININDLYKD